MDEKVLCTSKRGRIINNALLFGILLLAIFLFMYALNVDGCRVYDWGYRVSIFDNLFWQEGSHFAAIIGDAGIAFVIIGLIIYAMLSSCELTITDKRAYGKVKNGLRVDLPIDSITAVGSIGKDGITISSSSGVLKFHYIANRDEMYDCINKLLIERQKSKKEESIKVAPVASSGVEDLVKFKELLDNGVISQEEFDDKKKQILGL